MKLVSVIGVRPNFIKEYAIDAACKKHGIEKKIIHTGQHFDSSMSDVFFSQLGIPRPDYHYDLIKSHAVDETASMMMYISDVLKVERPDAVVVYGDVNSTLAASIAAVKNKIPVAHIEAGVRGQSLYNPEEINRRVSDVVSEYLFPNTAEAHEILLKENFPEERVFYCGDIMYDALLRITKEQGIQAEDGDYVVVTLHREENADERERLSAIVKALIDSGQKIVWPLHPRTRKRLNEFGLLKDVAACARIQLQEPLGYIEFLRLLAGCRLLVSDSGGARREAYMLRKPVLSLIEIVWVQAMVDLGWEIVVGADYGKILQTLSTPLKKPSEYPPLFGDGMAADKIISTLVEKLRKKMPVQAAAPADESPDPARQTTNVTVVIPIYNEQDSLPSLFSKLENLEAKVKSQGRYLLDFIFVDDGSKDRSFDILHERFRDAKNARLIRKPVNGGLGSALKEGLRASTGEIVVTIDADSNYDHLEIPRLLDAMTDEYDVVTASPFLIKNSWNYPFHRFVMSKSIVSFYKFALRGKGNQIHTFTSGFRAYRRRILRNIFPESNDFVVTAELLTRALLNGFKVKEVHTVIHERLYGTSKLKTLRTIRSHLKFLGRVYFGRLGGA